MLNTNQSISPGFIPSAYFVIRDPSLHVPLVADKW